MTINIDTTRYDICELLEHQRDGVGWTKFDLLQELSLLRGEAHPLLLIEAALASLLLAEEVYVIPPRKLAFPDEPRFARTR